MIYRKSLRTTAIASIIFALAVGLAAAGSWPAGPWNAPFIIQNMGSSPATITAQFYSIGTGSLEHTETCPTTAPGDNCTIRPHWISDANLPPGQYSVVVSASEPVASISNVSSADGRLMAYSASSPTGSTLYFPNFNKNYFDWNTPVYIQNAGSTATTVFLEFFPVGGGAVYHSMTTPSIQPGAAYEFDPVDQAGLSDGAYSLKATGTVTLAGTLAQLRPAAGQEMAVNAFAAGAETLYCPNINRNYGAENWTTPVVIQNMGSSAVSPHVYYYAVNVPGHSPGDLVNDWTLASIDPGESVPERPHWRSDVELPPGIYSLKVEGGSGSELAAIVNQESQNGTGGSMAYAAFAAGGTEVFLPNINKYYGAEIWNTPFLIQNVGSATADVKVEYIQGGSVVKTVTSADDPTLVIGPGGASAQRPHWLSDLPNGKYSVRVTSLGGSPPPLVAIVNQQGTVAGASSVEGITQ